MNKNIVIGILVVIIIALGGYAIWKAEAPASVVPVDGSSSVTQTSQTSSTQPTVSTTTSSTQQTSSTSSTNLYKSTVYHFQMTLPTGISLNQGGLSWTANTPYGTPGIRNIAVGPSCNNNASGSASQVVSTIVINGITFQKITGSGAFGGMESGSIDASYCAPHYGQYYTLIFTDEYDRVDPNVQKPDPTATYKLFDQEMKNLNFTFTK